MIYFSGCHHFQHANIIIHCGRNFINVGQMNRYMIDVHNEIVKPEDTVYMLGDFFWGRNSRSGNSVKLESILKQMNGHKHLILGNHDEFSPFAYVRAGFESVHTSLMVEDFYLVHDPAVSCIDRRQKFLCSHVHDLFKKQKNVLNVGVDVWAYKPVSIDEAYKEFGYVEKSICY